MLADGWSGLFCGLHDVQRLQNAFTPSCNTTNGQRRESVYRIIFLVGICNKQHGSYVTWARSRSERMVVGRRRGLVRCIHVVRRRRRAGRSLPPLPQVPPTLTPSCISSTLYHPRHRCLQCRHLLLNPFRLVVHGRNLHALLVTVRTPLAHSRQTFSAPSLRGHPQCPTSPASVPPAGRRRRWAARLAHLLRLARLLFHRVLQRLARALGRQPAGSLPVDHSQATGPVGDWQTR